jgi:hypothetical protein
MADATDINELFSQGQQGLKKAEETSKGPIDTIVSIKNRGYLPEMVGGTAAAMYTGLGIKNYVQNLKAVKAAIEAEEQAVKKLRTPATKKGAQPFAKEGFTLSGAKDVKANMPQKGGAVPYTRLSNVTAVGGPEGTGLGVLKGQEAKTAAKMTAEQMIKYLRQESNLGATSTTPRIQVKGFQEGEIGRKTVVLSPENVASGKLPTTEIPAGELPRPPATTMAKVTKSPITLGNYMMEKFPNVVPAISEYASKAGPYLGKALQGVGLAGYGASLYDRGPVQTVLEYGVPLTRFSGIGPVIEAGRGSDLESRGRWVYTSEGEPKFILNQ